MIHHGRKTVFAAVITCAGVDEETRFFTGSVIKFQPKRMALTPEGALKLGAEIAKGYRRVISIDVKPVEATF